MDLRNSRGFELRNVYFTTAFFENIHQKWKTHHVELNSGTSKSSEQKTFCAFEDIDLREVPCKVT